MLDRLSGVLDSLNVIVPANEHRALANRGTRHRLPHRETDHDTRPVSAVLERPGQRLQPEKQPRSGHVYGRGDGPDHLGSSDAKAPRDREVRLRQSGAEVPASFLQHRVRAAEVHAARARDRLRALNPRTSNPRRAAHPRGPHGALSRSGAGRDNAREPEQPRGWTVRGAAAARTRAPRLALRALVRRSRHHSRAHGRLGHGAFNGFGPRAFPPRALGRRGAAAEGRAEGNQGAAAFKVEIPLPRAPFARGGASARDTVDLRTFPATHRLPRGIQFSRLRMRLRIGEESYEWSK